MSLCLLCPGPVPDHLRRPGPSARGGVAPQPQQPGQSQGGGDEGGGPPLLPGRPRHLAQRARGVPRHAVKLFRIQEPHKHNHWGRIEPTHSHRYS